MGRTLDYHELEYICSLMYETYHIPIQILNEKKNVLFNLPSSMVLNPIFSNHLEALTQLTDSISLPNFPIFRTSKFLENFFTIQLLADNHKYIINVGPSLLSSVTEDTIRGIQQDYSLIVNSGKLLSYYQSLPVIPKRRLLHASIHFTYLLTQEKIDEDMLVEKNQSLDQTHFPIKDAEITLSERRQNTSFHHNPSYEKRLFQAIKEGRKEDVVRFINLPPAEGEFGVLSKKSILRNQKNLCIAGITLATRSAIDGGLDSEIAFTLSDLFIQSLEDSSDVTEVQQLFLNALSTFAERVSQVKHQRYSKTIATCRHYIFKHLYQEITLSHLAKEVNMNPSYLSVLFKKEVGVPLSLFIQQAKIEEAKSLLSLTNYTITEIYTLLNFTDQSYFSKVFKKLTGMTPAEYRNEHSIS